MMLFIASHMGREIYYLPSLRYTISFIVELNEIVFYARKSVSSLLSPSSCDVVSGRVLLITLSMNNKRTASVNFMINIIGYVIIVICKIIRGKNPLDFVTRQWITK